MVFRAGLTSKLDVFVLEGREGSPVSLLLSLGLLRTNTGGPGHGRLRAGGLSPGGAVHVRKVAGQLQGLRDLLAEQQKVPELTRYQGNARKQ